jgi:2-methylisocitrate lyase-like PEP mutase family enzyme
MNDTLNRRLQALMAPGAGTILPGAGNALSARFIAAAGFEAVFVSGAAVANWHLGKPDVGLTSITELVDHVSAIRDAVDLPIIVDADTEKLRAAVDARHDAQMMILACTDARAVEGLPAALERARRYQAAGACRCCRARRWPGWAAPASCMRTRRCRRRCRRCARCSSATACGTEAPSPALSRIGVEHREL